LLQPAAAWPYHHLTQFHCRRRQGSAKERQRISTEAQNEAEELIQKVKEQQRILIEESEITRLAKQNANALLQEADAKANAMKEGAYNYSDEILSKLQDKIRDINNIIEENREVLRKM
ncbi:MAG: hypothetical protein PHE29_06305, partial [Tissierellia bacterium]|nr:hypothetical protein [Tissierellia bacterium]